MPQVGKCLCASKPPVTGDDLVAKLLLSVDCQKATHFYYITQQFQIALLYNTLLIYKGQVCYSTFYIGYVQTLSKVIRQSFLLLLLDPKPMISAWHEPEVLVNTAVFSLL